MKIKSNEIFRIKDTPVGIAYVKATKEEIEQYNTDAQICCVEADGDILLREYFDVEKFFLANSKDKVFIF